MKHYPAKIIAASITSIASFFLINLSVAADRDDSSTRARYEQEKDACLKGESNQSRDTCLREAGAARQQAKLGTLTTPGPDQLQRNRESRCNVHESAADREYCLRRMRGEGTQTGSAQSGGISRELTVIVKPGQ